MKLLLPIALFVAAVAAADCEAESIVEACLESENKKFKACGDSDYGCQCAAQEAIATCYNNCPKDSRREQAEGQVKIYCGNASVHGSSTTTKPTQSSSGTASATASTTGGSSSTGDADSADQEGEGSGSAGGFALSAGAVMAAVAGVMAVVV